MTGSGDLVVYSATGATGQRVVELAAAAGLKPIVAGRRREPLEQLARRFGLEVRTGGLDQLEAVCAGARVVVSCVGPYTHFGQPVLDTALRHGAHYVDCSGEPRWVQHLIDDHDSTARTAGSALVPGVGLGVAIDLAARTAAAEIGAPNEVETLTVAYRITGMRPSTASMRSTVELIATGAPVVNQGKVRYLRAARHLRRLSTGPAATFPTPDPLTLALMWPNARIECYVQSRYAALFFPALAAGGVLLRNQTVLHGARRLTNLFQAASPAQAKGHAVVTALATGYDTSSTAIATVSDLYEISGQAAFAVAEQLMSTDVEPGVRAIGQVLGDPIDVAHAMNIALTCRTERHLAHAPHPST